VGGQQACKGFLHRGRQAVLAGRDGHASRQRGECQCMFGTTRGSCRCSCHCFRVTGHTPFPPFSSSHFPQNVYTRNTPNTRNTQPASLLTTR
jgi:hypothetical protein